MAEDHHRPVRRLALGEPAVQVSTLLAGCGNRTLLETLDRMWTASELARRWSAQRAPGRDHVGEHRRLEETVLARDADTAAEVLAQHLTLTAAGLTDSGAFPTPA